MKTLAPIARHRSIKGYPRFKFTPLSPYFLFVFIFQLLFFQPLLYGSHIATFNSGCINELIEQNKVVAPPPVVTSYTSFQDGNWSDPDTWVGTTAPPTTLSGDNVTIHHVVTYDSGDDMQINNGSVLLIEEDPGNTTTEAKLLLNEISIFVGKIGAGAFNMDNGLVEITGQSGNLSFDENSTASIVASRVTVAGNWESVDASSDRSFIGGCLFIENGNFENLGTDFYNGVCLELGENAGDWNNNGTVNIGENGIVVKAHTGNFQNNATVNGPGSFKYVAVQSSGTIAHSSSGTWDTDVKIDDFCWIGDNGSISGFPAGTHDPGENCTVDGNFFPCSGCEGQSNALPVEWLSFKATTQKQQVALSWKTATEENNMGFEVQRSTNGVDWKIIGFEDGRGTTDEIQSYTFTDIRPIPGYNYYRLKQIDYDGKYDFSEVRSVLVSSPKNQMAQVFPNPNEGIFTLALHNPQLQKARIKLLDSTGSLLREFNFSEYEVTPYWETRLELPQREVYLLVTQVGDQIETKKISVISRE